jgi:hexulose-6-phosphate isomerase
MQLGIMQGRLVPPTEGRIQCFPRDRWRDEFGLAADAGLTAIEWIDDVHGEDVNPLATDAGLAEMRSLAEDTGVSVRSVCADWFMDRSFLRAEPADVVRRVERLRWLLGRCHAVGARRVVLPFVDASRIETDDERDQVVDILERVLPEAEDTRVELHLETSLAPGPFADLLARLPAPLVSVNYDSGNSASLGYAPRDEFAAYGDRVGSVHIKDRVAGGSTVPLGQGDTDFGSLFDCLRKTGYAGDYVLQAARGTPGDEVGWARRNVAFVRTAMAGTV